MKKLALPSQAWLTGLAFTLTGIATIIHMNVVPFEIGFPLWFLLAVFIGFCKPSWPTFLLALIPWPIGISVGWQLGLHPFIGEFWPIGMLLSWLAGLTGIASGILSRHIFAKLTKAI